MQMVTKTRRWTRDDLAALPDDGNRYEVLDGELLVTPQAAYRHQRIATRRNSRRSKSRSTRSFRRSAGLGDSPRADHVRRAGIRFFSTFTSTVYSGSTSWMMGALENCDTNW